MSYSGYNYEKDAQSLKDAIKELIIKYPHILEFTSPWPLLKIEEFKPIQRTLAPSLAQATAAWRAACIEIEMEERGQLKVNGEYIKKPRFEHPAEKRAREKANREMMEAAGGNRWTETL